MATRKVVKLIQTIFEVKKMLIDTIISSIDEGEEILVNENRYKKSNGKYYKNNEKIVKRLMVEEIKIDLEELGLWRRR